MTQLHTAKSHIIHLTKHFLTNLQIHRPSSNSKCIVKGQRLLAHRRNRPSVLAQYSSPPLTRPVSLPLVHSRDQLQVLSKFSFPPSHRPALGEKHDENIHFNDTFFPTSTPTTRERGGGGKKPVRLAAQKILGTKKNTC